MLQKTVLKIPDPAMSSDRPSKSAGGDVLPDGNANYPTHIQLLFLLREGYVLTQGEMTDRLPISSKRQARRLIGKLKEAGLPIEESLREREKEYGLPPEEWRAEVRLDLTEREALALMLAAGAAESGLGPAPLKEALVGAAECLVQSLPRTVSTFDPTSLLSQLHFGEAASVDVSPEVHRDRLLFRK